MGKRKETANDDEVLSTWGCRAPLMHPVALPNIEESSDMVSPELLYSGPEMGMPIGVFDGVPETIAL